MKIRPRVISNDFSPLTGRIGLFGGTFDPFHYGHLSVAEAVTREQKLDHLVFIPAKRNPDKAHSPIGSEAERLEAIVKISTRDTRFLVSTIELDREENEPSLTVTTLKEVRKTLAPSAELYFILGLDSAITIPEWEDPEAMFELTTGIITVNRGVFNRDSIVELGNRLAPKFIDNLLQHHVPITPIEISSTEIRLGLKSPWKIIDQPGRQPLH